VRASTLNFSSSIRHHPERYIASIARICPSPENIKIGEEYFLWRGECELAPKVERKAVSRPARQCRAGSPVRERAAAFAGLCADRSEQALLIHYGVGAGIG